MSYASTVAKGAVENTVSDLRAKARARRNDAAAIYQDDAELAAYVRKLASQLDGLADEIEAARTL